MQVTGKNEIGTMGLVMITLAGISSPIGMVIMAKYGLSAMFYYLLVIVLFFIPSAMVCSELGSGWPQEGGMYHWVSVAFGRLVGNLALWLQWLSILISFPVILTFVASIISYAINPAWIHHGGYVAAVCLVLTLFSVLFSSFGIKLSTFISGVAFFCAILIPVVLIIVFAIIWLLAGHHSAVPLVSHSLLPKLNHMGSYALLGATVFMFGGMELAAYCLQFVKNPKKDYKNALIISTVVVVLLSVFGTLAIAVLVPTADESLVGGMMQAFLVFLNAYHLHFLIYFIMICSFIGYMGVICTYMFTLSHGLLASSKDHMLPKFFSKRNRFNVPINIVLVQGVITIALALVYVFMPVVSSAYWMIEAVVAVAGGLRYVILFAAAISLRYTHPNAPRTIKVPGGKTGIWIVSGAGFLMCGFATAMTFAPPSQFSIGKVEDFEIWLFVGSLICILLPIVVSLVSLKMSGMLKLSHSKHHFGSPQPKSGAKLK